MKFKFLRPVAFLTFYTLLLLVATICGDAKTLQVYILTGQSNSLGSVKGSPASKQLLQQYKSNGSTKFWHTNFNKTSGRPIDTNPPPSTSWGEIVPQICSIGSSQYNCMGPEYGFASMMEKKKWNLSSSPTKDEISIGIIKASLDGGGKEYWNKGMPAYRTIINTVNTATAKARRDGYDKVQIVGVLYLQGESNNNDTRVGEDFLTFLTNLESEIATPGVDTSLLKKQQAILGEHALWSSNNITDPKTGDITAGNNGNRGKAGKTSEQHYDLAKSRKNMGWVPTRDLAKITRGDGMGVHYDGKSQITIGARYAYEAARLAGYNTGCVRNGNSTVPLRSAKAWSNGQLPLKSIAVWDVSSSAKDNMTGSSSKEKAALFGIRIDDPYLNTITIRGIMEGNLPSLKDSFLALGRGGIEIAKGKNLRIASVLLISGSQKWKIAGTSSLHITSSDQSAKSKGTILFGEGDLSFSGDQKQALSPREQASVTIDLATPSNNKPYTGNWDISPFIKLIINGEESSHPSIILDNLTLHLKTEQTENTTPILSVSGSNFSISKNIILDILDDVNSATSISFRIINPGSSKLAKTLRKAKFSLSPLSQSKGWKIDSFDDSSGTITLSIR